MQEVCACEFLENARVRIDTALRDGEDAVAEDGWREEREEAAAADHQSIAGFFATTTSAVLILFEEE